MTSITFNGRTYNSLNEMPANERQAYEQMMNIFVDKDGNGIPDFLEGDMVQNVLKAYTTNISADGNTIQSINDLPPETRESVKNAFKILSQLGVLPKDAPTSVFSQPAPQISREPKFVSREYNPMIQEDKRSSPRTWIMLGVLSLLCCIGAAGFAYYVLFILT